MPENRVDLYYKSSSEYNFCPFDPGNSYCQIWLVEMRLSKGVEWFKRRYPVVHSVIRFDHGRKNVTIPYIAGPGFIRNLTKRNLDRIIQCNHPLSPLFPANRGTVGLQAGLFSIPSGDVIKSFINVLGRFSGLLPVPELSSVLQFANPVYDGIQDFLNAGSKRLEIGYENTFDLTGSSYGNCLKAGYLSVIQDEYDKIDVDKLCVVNNSLRIGKKGSSSKFLENDTKYLDGHSYILLRIKFRPDQDWDALTRISKLVERAHIAILNGKLKEVKNKLLPVIMYEIVQSPDIATRDKKKMYSKIITFLKEQRLHSTRKIETASLYHIMQMNISDSDLVSDEEWDAMEDMTLDNQ